MWYKIIPNDTLFFRSGIPFTMGAESWTEIIFPPNPTTLYGAIRTWLIFEKGSLKDFKEGRFKEELGTTETKGSLKIKGSILLKGELLFPSPLDLLKKKENKRNDILKSLTFSERPDIFISDYQMDGILVWKGMEHIKEAEGYITAIYLSDYLLGKKGLRLTEKDELYIVESKIGIARNRITKTTVKGHLYHVPMIRLKDEKLKGDVAIAVWIEGVEDVPESGIIQLGGEGKTAKIEKMESDLLQEIKGISLSFNNRLFKIYLATPAIFEKGYLPSWIDENTLQGEHKGIKLKLVGCVIGKYKLIGGWDMAENKPKPMRRAVPAGSVYYFQILDDSDVQKVKDVFHFKNISDIYPEEGYGLTFIGSVS
ncbi:MAG: type III-B CRISPR module-associated protein Cmr3 [Caldisericia bacterium]|jgi:CRISPR-associated protein Cmr3|nr:type III-B CRISPR module-associated protein Cmr3 [Caldisericia bacterium]